ncbi:MAG: RIP metalloprotease RseP [Proteobacteria bacterium]|nr:RIP metalloprotease RseP [Pseudomonadota bacterium]
MAVVYIVILIGVLVFVHEFGHYVAARIFDVKVESFSIGFGRRIAGFKRGETSWDIRLLPLGGYVQMYGTEFEEVTDEEDPDYKRAYNNKPIWQKALICFAGPLFNLLLPIPILFGVYLATVTEAYPPIVGTVMDGSAAYGVLEPGDKIKQINDVPIRYWYELHDEVAKHPNEKLDVLIERNGAEQRVSLTPSEIVLRDVFELRVENKGRIGVTLSQAVPMIGIVEPDGPAARAGLLNFDEIVAVNGTPVHTYVELEKALLATTNDELVLDILRAEALDVAYGGVSMLTPQTVTLHAPERSSKALGMTSAAAFVTQVDADSPAALAGLKTGDQILMADGKPVSTISSTLDNLAQDWESVHKLKVRRDGKEFETDFQLKKMTITGEFQEEMPIIYAGMYSKIPTTIPDLIPKPFGDRLNYAVSTSFKTTVDASTILVVSIARMFQGRVSTKTLGGPILIGHMAQKAGEEGASSFLQMLALISINLGIINLVPIPLLDGGKLFILLVEAIKHGPISMRARQIIAYVGIAMVALLMLVAFKNDIERMWNLFFG